MAKKKIGDSKKVSKKAVGPNNTEKPEEMVEVTLDKDFVKREMIKKNPQLAITYACAEVMGMLLDKNRKYGNSALNPMRIFSKTDAVEQLKVRIDDKLSRINTCNPRDREDAELDLIGYLILKRVAEGNFDLPDEIELTEDCILGKRVGEFDYEIKRRDKK